MDQRFPEILCAAKLKLEAFGLRPDEKVVILASTASYPALVDAYYSAAVALRADPVLVTYGSRQPLSGLSDLVVEMVALADAVIDLNANAWAYSDSLAKFHQLQKERGGRRVIMHVFGSEEDELHTLLNCPPSEDVLERSRRAQNMIDVAKTIHVTSELGTDLTVARGDRPSFAPQGQVCFFPPDDSVNGLVYFVGGFRTVAPTVLKRMVYHPVRMEIENGKLVKIERSSEAGVMLDDWFRGVDDPNVYQFAHINLGLDHRIVLHHLDNFALHFNYGGILMGFGANNSPRLGGNVRSKGHIEMQLTGANCLLDGRLILESGEFTADSGLRAPGRH